MSLKGAVIGAGSMGKNHVRVLSELEQVELVGVADKNEEVRGLLKKKYGVSVFEDYKELLKEQIDFVCIAVPTEMHEEVAIACIEKNLHVLLEKPIASSSEAAKKIISHAEKAGVKLMIGHLERFNPAINELKKRIESGEAGTIYQLEADRLGPYPLGRIKDSGVVIDLSVHDIDIMTYLVGKPPKKLYASTEKRIHTTNEDLMIAILHFPNDVIGLVKANWLTPTKKRKLRITGDQGVFEADYITQELYYYENSSRHGDEETNTVFTISEGAMQRFFVQKQEPLKMEIKHFVSCVQNDSEPIITGKHGLQALLIAEEIISSAEKEEVVDVEQA